MRIATFTHQGRRQVGALAADGQHIDVFALSDEAALRGAQALIDSATLPAVSGRVALAEVQLLAPLPLPRRNLFCVGRNYHAHA